MKRKFLVSLATGFFLIFGIAGVPYATFATQITFIQSGNGSGSIGSTPFSDENFTITSIGNTDDRVSFTNGYYIPNQSTSININNVGVFDFTTATMTFVNNQYQLAGLSELSGWDLFYAPLDSSFSSWDMLSDIGPIAGTGSLQQWDMSPYAFTTSGQLLFDTRSCSATFQAVISSPVPEPSTMLLLGFGLLCLAGVARKRIKA